MATPSLLLKASAAAAAAALALTACSSTKTEATADNPYALKDKSTLTICSNPPYAPFEFQQGGTDVVGFDMDLAKAIADDLKVSTTVQLTSFEEIQSSAALTANKCDVGISGITINDARKTKMDFSDPYYDDNMGLLVKKGSSIKTVEDAKSAKVGVQAGTTGADYAKKQGITAVEFKDSGLLVQALQAGTVDAAIGNKSTLGYTAGDDSSLVFAQEIPTGEQLGVAVKKGNTKLVEEINKVLKEYKSSGKMAESQKKWFGTASK